MLDSFPAFKFRLIAGVAGWCSEKSPGLAWHHLKSPRLHPSDCRPPGLQLPGTSLGPTDLDRRTPTRARRPAAPRGLPAGAAAVAGQGRRRPGRPARSSGRGSLPPAVPGQRPGLPARPRPAPDQLSAAWRSLGAAGSYDRLSQARCHLRPWKRRAGQSCVTQRGGPASELPPKLPPRAARAARGRRAPYPRAHPLRRPPSSSTTWRPALDAPAPLRQRGRCPRTSILGNWGTWRCGADPARAARALAARGAFSSTCSSRWSKAPFLPCRSLNRHTPAPT